MEKEIKFSRGVSASPIVTDLIKGSLIKRREEEINQMSAKEKRDNAFSVVTPKIPKTKKEVENSIDDFISDLTQSGEVDELLELLGYYDGEETTIYKALHKRIKDKDVDKAPDKVKKIVKEELMKLSKEQLYELDIFGFVITEEDVERNKEFYIKYGADDACFYLSFYTVAILTGFSDPIEYSGRQMFDIHNSEKRKVDPEAFIDRASYYVNKYPVEAKACHRGHAMLLSKFKESVVKETVNKILTNEL